MVASTHQDSQVMDLEPAPVSCACLLDGKVVFGKRAATEGHTTWVSRHLSPSELTHRCSNLGRHLRPLHSALACWSTRRPQGSPHWRPVPTASLMNCGLLEPSSPTIARFPPSSTSVLVVSIAWGQWRCWGCGEAWC